MVDEGASQRPARALDGIRVLDLSRVLAGPWATQILGDFGADVLKIELPDKGDDTRGWGPPFLTLPDGQIDPQESAYYLCCNRNKRSVAIDLAKPEGATLVRRLAAEADIVVENFKVGGLEKYGLDYASLRAVNPRLVYCSITGFGQSGPYAERPGFHRRPRDEPEQRGGRMGRSQRGEVGGGEPVGVEGVGLVATVPHLPARLLRLVVRVRNGQET